MVIATRSPERPRCTAAMTPSGMLTMTTNTIAQVARLSEFSGYSPASSVTG